MLTFIIYSGYSLIFVTKLMSFPLSDSIEALIAKFMKMMNAMNHSDCPGSGEKCLWPNYHAIRDGK